MTVDITIVLGTRPEIIKLAPLIRECKRRSLDVTLIHTGQHYSDELDSVFFDQLALPVPDHELGVGSKPHGPQTAEMLHGVADCLRASATDVTLVQGDTNSTLAGALAACKQDTVLGHVEAGLRSFDREMPEELNRTLTDHAADLLFAPTQQAADRLSTEAIPDERIFITGNTVVDAVNEHVELAEKRSTIHRDQSVTAGRYGLLTVHRAENVDDQERFAAILEGVGGAATELGMEVIYPVHPRAEQALDSTVPIPEPIHLVSPLDYLDFLALERHARLVFTDSGGVQEEACILGTPCVTVRNSTERPETLEVGSNQLVGADPSAIRRGAREMVDVGATWDNPFGDGTASTQIIDSVVRATAGREVLP